MNGLNGLLGDKTISGLEQMASFTQARQKVIAENIANVDTPGYSHKRVDLGSFQQALAKAMSAGPDDAAVRQVTSQQVQRDAAGYMVLRPAAEPTDNLTFHDGTNNRIETEMADMSRNQILNQVATDLLARKYRGLEAAIRGKMT